MVMYSCNNLADAFHAIQDIATGKEAKVSFLSGNLAAPKDIDSLEVDFLPAEIIRRDVISLSGEELMLQYMDCDAKGLFLSFPLTDAIVFRLLFFGGTVLMVSALSKSKICVPVPEDVEEIMEKYGVARTAG